MTETRRNDIAVVMVTVDRAPNENYLHGTLWNLIQSGVFRSERLHTFHLVDSGSPRAEDWQLWWPDRALRGLDPPLDWGPQDCCHIITHEAPERRSGKQNTVAALRAGAQSDTHGLIQWVLHLEDDLAVCDDFLGSVGRWLDRFAGDDLTLPTRALYPFSGDNATIRTQLAKGEAAWEYPVQWFWGLQAFACRPAVALDLAQWLADRPIYMHTDGRPDANAHDLEMHHWARARGYTHFRGSCPSFVQHVGYETSILGNAMGGARVTFPSWPGREWSYR